MRRHISREIKNYEIVEIYPRFKWTQCGCCLDKFKKEPMWKVILLGYRWGNISYSSNIYNKCFTYCQHCYTKEKLVELCEKKAAKFI